MDWDVSHRGPDNDLACAIVANQKTYLHQCSKKSGNSLSGKQQAGSRIRGAQG
jgi:hypothetical protein